MQELNFAYFCEKHKNYR